MNGISFNLANYCARQTGWNMTKGWGEGETASMDYFRPVKTFGPRFEEYITDVKSLGFNAVDMWTGILDPRWVTDEHVATALDLLRKHEIAVYSYGGWLGSTPDDFTSICDLASQFGAPFLGGMTSMLEKDRGFVVSTLQKYGVKLGIENHLEKTPEQVLAKIGDGGEGTIGACVDTGWFGTQGYDAADALEKLADHLFIVHLKDVREVGKHDTCRYGEGVVPIERCVSVLKQIGYNGTISVEHEPEHFDPAADMVANLQMLKGWLAE